MMIKKFFPRSPWIYTPTSSTTVCVLGTCFAAISSDTNSASTPTKNSCVTSTNGTSPAMTRFFSSQESSGGTKKGYYDDLTFLNNMSEFLVRSLRLAPICLARQLSRSMGICVN